MRRVSARLPRVRALGTRQRDYHRLRLLLAVGVEPPPKLRY
ncbi:hypothetical protein ACIQVR_32640 [Streptomyces xanthochromogenes]